MSRRRITHLWVANPVRGTKYSIIANGIEIAQLADGEALDFGARFRQIVDREREIAAVDAQLRAAYSAGADDKEMARLADRKPKQTVADVFLIVAGELPQFYKTEALQRPHPWSLDPKRVILSVRPEAQLAYKVEPAPIASKL